jgi:spore germination protein YaaH
VQRRVPRRVPSRARFLAGAPRLGLWLGAWLCLPQAAGAQKLESLWYSTGRAESTRSFVEHAANISIVSPQVFSIDRNAAIRGSVDPRVIAAARASGTKVVPLVMNPGFDQPTIHRILNSAALRRRAASNIAALCRANHFDGIQLDVENVNVVDRDVFTAFAREVAAALHAVGCTASAAVVPRASDDPGPTSWHKWIYANWRGAYDYKALVDTLDFISYMTYAQHTGGTTPGPVAGVDWVERDLQFVLSLGVPPAKISLGIPSYSDWWYPAYTKRAGAGARGSDISFARAESLLATNHAQLVWDAAAQVSHAFWSDDGVYDHLWLEDARSFAAKAELVRKYHLRGYSVWVLGLEDPKVWAVAP